MTPAEIKALRLTLRLYQAEFAAKLGVSRQSVSDWETGRRRPGIKSLRKLDNLKKMQVNDDFS